ncbi:GvpG protein, cluster B (plasmid) [Halobacterium salinarum NRC-1]|nr:GvpG protein, cluster B [Halobacterium salinarum NRC-1]
MALDELYDTSEIRDQIKENQLLYEIGDRPADEYERRKQELEAQLRTAEQIRDQMRDRMEIKN